MAFINPFFGYENNTMLSLDDYPISRIVVTGVSTQTEVDGCLVCQQTLLSLLGDTKKGTFDIWIVEKEDHSGADIYVTEYVSKHFQLLDSFLMDMSGYRNMQEIDDAFSSKVLNASRVFSSEKEIADVTCQLLSCSSPKKKPGNMVKPSSSNNDVPQLLQRVYRCYNLIKKEGNDKVHSLEAVASLFDVSEVLAVMKISDRYRVIANELELNIASLAIDDNFIKKLECSQLQQMTIDFYLRIKKYPHDLALNCACRDLLSSSELKSEGATLVRQWKRVLKENESKDNFWERLMVLLQKDIGKSKS